MNNKMGRDEEEMRRLEARLIELKSHAKGHDHEHHGIQWKKVVVIVLCLIFFSAVGFLGLAISTEFRPSPLILPDSDYLLHRGGLYWAEGSGLTYAEDRGGLIYHKSYKNVLNQSITVFSDPDVDGFFAFVWIAGPDSVLGMYGMIDTNCDGIWKVLDVMSMPIKPLCISEKGGIPWPG